MIEFKDVSFRYNDDNNGIANINLSVKKGECVVLTGKSGCGKTTITRLINGLAPKHYIGTRTGSIYIDGKDIETMQSYEIGRVVGSIFQDPRRQFFSSELEGEIAFACENYGFTKTDIHERTNDAIHMMSLKDVGDTSLDLLSSGEKQRTAIASVYSLKPQIFVFDEPTANLDKKGMLKLKEIVAALKMSGYTLVIAEHRISWIGDIADRYVYMENGEIRNEYSCFELQQMNDDERVSKGLRNISDMKFIKPPIPTRENPILIETEALYFKKDKKQILEDVNLFINENSITAITGDNGAGKTSLSLLLSGLEKLKTGTVKIRGEKAKYKKLRNDIYYCSNDTGTQFFTESVLEELLLGVARNEKVLSEARALLSEMNLCEYEDAHPAALSGGQKQRLAVLCALMSSKSIIILDEPTSGLDGANMILIANSLKNAVKGGKTIIVVTHDDEFIDECCGYRFNMTMNATNGLH